MASLLFLLVLPIVLVFPGLSLLFFLERKSRIFTLFERSILSVSLSLVMVTFLMIGMGKAGIPLVAGFLLLGIAGVSGIFLILAYRGGAFRGDIPDEVPASLRVIPRVLVVAFALLLLIKLFALIPNILPNSTDLGHHLYWVKKIALEGVLPTYEKRDIVSEGGHSVVSDPQPISDFIIGEHLVLVALQLLSDMPFDSSFSLLALFVIHIASLFALFSLTARLFERHPSGMTLATVAFVLVGILYSIAQPQMKYVIGGVVGNTFGNLLIPAIVLMLLLSYRLSRVDLSVVAILLGFGLAYTHHLSALLFACAVVGIVTGLFVAERRGFLETMRRMIVDRRTVTAILFCILFFVFVYRPSYIENAAVGTVIGEPEKIEHQGYTIGQLVAAVGDPRAALAIGGVILLFLAREARRSQALPVLLGWSLPLAVLVLFPDLVRIDLPSGRVANYLIAPIGVLAAVAVVFLYGEIRERIPRGVLPIVIGVFLGGVILNGYGSNSSLLNLRTQPWRETRSLREASEYLRDRVPASFGVMHDHINIPGDAWIKLSFMKDYNYPFYRAHLFRYDRITDRQERCTLLLLSSPSSAEARACATDLNIRAVLVNEAIDGGQFKHFREYSQVYSDPFHAIFLRVHPTL